MILQSLSIEMQTQIHECTWDEETGRPLSKLDRELDNILETRNELDYVDISLITKEDTRPGDVDASNTFIPELDTNTVSTFGTVKNKNTEAIGLSKTPITDVDDKFILSGIMLDSRMSKMEEEFSNMTNMLKILVGRANTGNTDTQPITTQEAGGTVVSPARGV